MADEPTQIEQAKDAVRAVCAAIDEHLPALKAVIDAAQNRPPEGGSDGTIDAVTFSYLQTIKLALERAIQARAQLRSYATGEPVPPTPYRASAAELKDTVTPAATITDDDIPYLSSGRMRR